MAGDALGMPVEGWPRPTIIACFGELRDMLPGRLGPGSYPDDIEMTIGLAEALLDHKGRLDLGRVAFRY
jgi:poly(ADP-ribose) glycohydrolase ARH3